MAKTGTFLSIAGDQEGASPRLVTDVNGLPVLVDDHPQIHEGKGYQLSMYFAVGAGASQYIYFAPTKGLHLRNYQFHSDVTPATIALYESPTQSVAGAAQTPRNRNRYAADTPAVTIQLGGTYTSDGTFLDRDDIIQTSATQKGGEITGPNVEWILNHGKTYILKVTNGGAQSANILLRLFWYEWTPGS